jgi:hypothetical protein
VPRFKDRKTNRATRQSLTNFTVPQTSGDPFGVCPLDFPKIETVYVPLCEAARNEITAIVEQYLWLDQSEGAALTVEDCQTAIDRLVKSTDGLLTAIEDSASAENASVERQVRNLIDVRGRSNNVTTSEMLRVLELFKQTCLQARAEIEERSAKSGFKDGNGWREMVAGLLRLAETHDLPRAVSNRTATLLKPSKFVS